MGPLSFLQNLPLPSYGGLPVAATALRSLELFSDLALGLTPPATLKPPQRFDIMDECLDLVVVQPECPAGFAFTGLSLAGFWAALRRAHPDEASLAPWRSALASDEMDALRAGARRRIGDRPHEGYLREYWLRLPPGHEQAPLVELPAPLADLLQQADPAWRARRRSRLTIDLVEEVVAADQPFPLRGKQWPSLGVKPTGRWLRWPEYLMQPAEAGVEFTELSLALPSLEESYFSEHFLARNVFAHFRTSRFTTAEGQRVLLLNEVQSDWLRDLRHQRLGRRPTQALPYIPMISIPDCPLEADWLRLALTACVDLADEWGCDWVAWTPAVIQRELNPSLPSRVARRLYDHEVPRLLASLVSARHGELIAMPVGVVAYPTYRRDIQIGNDPGCGWYLMAMPGRTRLTETVRDFDAALNQLRARATPVTEGLIAMSLNPD